MDLRRARAWDWVAGLAGAVLIASLFLHWYRAPGGGSVTAWQAFTVVDVILFVVGLVGIALVVANAILPQVNNDTTPSSSQEEADAAAKREHTAWEPREAIDTVILLTLIAAAGLAITAAFVKASGRRGPPLSAWATIAGLIGTLLLA